MPRNGHPFRFLLDYSLFLAPQLNSQNTKVCSSKVKGIKQPFLIPRKISLQRSDVLHMLKMLAHATDETFERHIWTGKIMVQSVQLRLKRRPKLYWYLSDSSTGQHSQQSLLIKSNHIFFKKSFAVNALAVRLKHSINHRSMADWQQPHDHPT